MEEPLASVIIVTFNAKKFISACVDAVYKNNYPHFEVIVVDNGSTDGTKEELTRIFTPHSNFHYLYLKENRGPAFARNLGVAQSSGKYVAFLDSDTQPDSNWLAAMVKEFEVDKSTGALQCKLLLASQRNRYDYAGDFIGTFGFLVQRTKEEKEIDCGQYDKKEEILSAKSAGMGIRRDVFDIIRGFDEDYFIYLEETDLGWRTWLSGYKVKFLPESIVYHEFGTTNLLNPTLGNYNVCFHGTKNYISTLYKNLGTLKLLQTLPIHILMWVGMGTIKILQGKRAEGLLMFRGIYWFFTNLRDLSNKRIVIQTQRRISDKELFKIIARQKDLLYYISKFFAPKKIEEFRDNKEPQEK